MFAAALRQQGWPYQEPGELDTVRGVREHQKPQRREPVAFRCQVRPVQHCEAITGLGEGRLHHQRVGRRRADSVAHRVPTR